MRRIAHKTYFHAKNTSNLPMYSELNPAAVIVSTGTRFQCATI